VTLTRTWEIGVVENEDDDEDEESDNVISETPT
jgi:hypothetical protein